MSVTRLGLLAAAALFVPTFAQAGPWTDPPRHRMEATALPAADDEPVADDDETLREVASRGGGGEAHAPGRYVDPPSRRR